VYYPGSSGWIHKFFNLVENNDIILESYSNPIDIIDLGIETGLIFGIPKKMIFTSIDDTKEWTIQSKLKGLIFETMILIYLNSDKSKSFNKKNFFNSIFDFYFKTKNQGDKKEKIKDLEKKIHQNVSIKNKEFEHLILNRTIENPLLFIDVLLYYNHVNKLPLINKETFSMNVLSVIILTLYSDNVIDQKEKYLYHIYLTAANLNKKNKAEINTKFEKGTSITDISLPFNQNERHFTQYLLCNAIYIISLQLKIRQIDRKLIHHIGDYFSVPSSRIEILYAKTTVFIVKNKNKIPFLLDSKRKIIIKKYNLYFAVLLKRNKRKIVSEINESKELLRLLKKSKTKKLTLKEKEIVKEQLIDILKTIPSIAIFLVPGGSILLPILLKFIPAFLPSSFIDNKTEK